MNNSNLFNNFSSKIKKIYIELHDFGYIHGPIENNNSSKRFLGRKKVIERLKNILTNSLSKSGAYLITGYRGMGKSSFVNKVIDETKKKKEILYLFGRFFRIFLLVVFLSVLYFDWMLITGLVLALLISIYIYKTSTVAENTYKKTQPFLVRKLINLAIVKEFTELYLVKKFMELSVVKKIIDLFVVKKIMELFLVKKERRARFKFRNLLKDIFHALIVLIFSKEIIYRLLIFFLNNKKTYFLSSIIFGFLVFILINIIFSIVENWNIILNRLTKIKTIGHFLKFIGSPFVQFFENIYNYSKRIYIKINLGHEDLKEIDFLRLISRNISRKYNDKRILIYNNILWKVLFIFFIWFITIVIYKFPPILELNKNFKKNISLGLYLPSQIPFYLENEKDILLDIEKNLDKSNNFTFEKYVYSIKTLEIDFSTKSASDLFSHPEFKHNSLIDSIDINKKINNLSFFEYIDSIKSTKNFNLFKLDTVRVLSYLINEKDTTLYSEKFLHSILSNEDLKRINDLLLYCKYYDKFIFNFLQNIQIDYDLNNYINWEQLDTLPLETAKNLISTKKYLYKYIYNNFDSLELNTLIEEMIKLNGIPESQLSLNDANISSLLSHLYSNKELADSIINNISDPLDLKLIFLYRKHLSLYESINNLSTLKKYSAYFLSHIDLFIYSGYSEIRKYLSNRNTNKEVGSIFADDTKNLKIFKNILNLKILPPHLDYLFFFYFIIIWLIVRLVLRQKLFGKLTSKDIRKRLVKLNEIIDAQVSTEKHVNLNDGKLFGLAFKKTKKYPIADVRDIEKWLIEIIEDIEKLPRYLYKPEFIFVFDELDKIEPQNNTSINEKTEEQQIFNNEQTAIFSPEGTRSRQNTVLKLLSNLKYFLSTAKAKFIFIAGREMFDASLADVSDRNFFIGSIFHDVIYLQSFLTDETSNEKSDITGMTEHYVCNFIMPHNLPESNTNLQDFNQYLIQNFEMFDDNSKESTIEKRIAKLKREKVIFILHEFITYLTHVSNGAPNKIARYFENYIVKENEIVLESNEVLRVGKNHNNLYLCFDYQQQYTLGMINYLINPINLSINNNVKSYGDKLLVSASFLVDHLFKFHRNAFSWRNLEITPEIVDINKTPELRNFITQIISYLTQTHINEIVNGLFDFKFPKRISQEISYLSKISEEASAAFNFTLDESLSIKHYYQKLLSNLTSRYNKIYGRGGLKDYIRSIAMIHMILGDLYFYDEEFGDASLEYLNSLQYFKKIKSDEFTLPLMVLYIRNMLKLGLTYEKRKTYDSAFLTYGEVTTQIIQYRDISLNDLNLTVINYEIADRRNIDDKTLLKKLNKPILASDVEDDYFKKPDFLNIPHETFTPNKEKIYFKLTSFEGIRLFFQSLLAKFQIIEKSNLGGITNVDIVRLCEEFVFMIKTIEDKEKHLISSEFWNKVGGILYYKNGFVHKYEICNEKNKTNSAKKKELIKNDEIRYQSCFKIIMNNKRKLKSPCSACKFYNKGLQFYLENYILFEAIPYYNNTGIDIDFEINQKFHLTIILRALEAKAFITQRKNSYKTIANLLSDIGDLYLSCATREDKVDKKFMNNFLKFIENKKYKDFIEYIEGIWNNLPANQNPRKLEKMLLFFYLAYKFYKKANEHKNASFQLSKIISFLRVYCTANKSFIPFLNTIFDQLENIIVRKSIQSLYVAYENIHVLEITRFKRIFSPEGKRIKNDISLNKGTINSEIDDIIYIFQDLKLKCKPNDQKFEEIRKNWQMNLVSPFVLVDNIYNRILKLEYKANLNYEIIKIIGFERFDSPFSDIDNTNHFLRLFSLNKEDSPKKDILEKIQLIFQVEEKDQTSEEKLDTNKNVNYIFDNIKNLEFIQELVEFLITDSIFCLHEIIKISKRYGKSFMVNHSFLARNHKKLMFWSELYYLYLYFFELIGSKNSTIENQLKDKIDKLHRDTNHKLKSRGKDEIKESLINELETNILNFNNLIETNIDEKLSSLIKKDNVPSINTTYQCEKTIKEYHSAIETHTEGSAYKNSIEEMYYLNDDFNDNSYHFSSAIERYLLKNKMRNDDLKKLKVKVKDSVIYKHESYLKTIIEY